MPEKITAPGPGLTILLPVGEPPGFDLKALVACLMAPAPGGEPPCIVLVPEADGMPACLGGFADDRPAPVTATHGSPLKPGDVLVLPAGRHFVFEEGRLSLRPATMAAGLHRLERLLSSLGPASASTLLVLCDPPAEDDARFAPFRAAGGRIVSPEEVLGGALAPGRPAPAGSEPAPILTTGLAHEVRQPLQTLVLLQGLLKRQVKEPRQIAIVERMGETLAQLNALLSAPPAAGQRVLLPVAGEADDPPPMAADGARPLVYVIDDDASIRAALQEVLTLQGIEVRDFAGCEQFLEHYGGESQGCLLVDAYLPGMSGLDLLEEMGRRGHPIPSILMTGSSDVRMAVSAMKLGASDFLEKPVTEQALLTCVRTALQRARNTDVDHGTRERALQALKGLTRRQRQIMTMVLDGHPSKNIAADLGISQRTVENHRAAIMRRTGSRSLPQLARLILALPAAEIE